MWRGLYSVRASAPEALKFLKDYTFPDRHLVHKKIYGHADHSNCSADKLDRKFGQRNIARPWHN